MSFTLPSYLIYLFGGATLLLMNGKSRKWYAVAFAALGLVSVLSLRAGTAQTLSYLGFSLTYLKVDKLSLIVSYAFAIIGLLAIVYSLNGSKGIQSLGLLYTGSALGAVLAGDYLTLYVFWELLAILGAGLIFLSKSDESRAAGLRYLYFHIIGGVALLGGIMFNFLSTGSFEITKSLGGWPMVFILLGVGINCAFVFLHTWLPDSYPKAPFMASVFLSVYTTKTAVYLLARTAYGLQFVAYMGAAMAVFGVTMALMQSNARKLLSYHIVSQVGYMVAAIGIGTAIGINGGIFHLFNNIFYKALLFMTIGAVIYKVGEEDLTNLGSLAKRMPLTAGFAVIASLSIAGFPFFNGFASKHMIFEAAHGRDFLYLLLELAAVGTALSFLKFSYFVFFKKAKVPDTKPAQFDETQPSMLIAMGGAAVLCVLVGVYPTLITKILPFAEEAKIYSTGGVIGSLLLFGITAVLFFAGISYFQPHKRTILDFDYIYAGGVSYLTYIPVILDWINNTLELILEKVAISLNYIKQPSEYIGDFISNTVFAFFMDMWLVEKSKLKTPTLPERSFGALTFISLPISYVGDKLSGLSLAFDQKVIDKLVNFLGAVTTYIGGKVKKLQVGSVQTYAIAMVIALIILILLTKGGR